MPHYMIKNALKSYIHPTPVKKSKRERQVRLWRHVPGDRSHPKRSPHLRDRRRQSAPVAPPLGLSARPRADFAGAKRKHRSLKLTTVTSANHVNTALNVCQGPSAIPAVCFNRCLFSI